MTTENPDHPDDTDEVAIPDEAFVAEPEDITGGSPEVEDLTEEAMAEELEVSDEPVLDEEEA